MRKYTKSFFIYFFIFGVLVQLTNMAFGYIFDYIDVKNDIKSKYGAEVKAKTKLLKTLVSEPRFSIDSILDNRLFSKYLSEPMENKENIENLFLYILMENKSYMQVRFIDINGNEKIRVDRDYKTSNTKIIASDNLQNKKNRYYFKKTMDTPKDIFWLSDIDLNIEHGKIQVPYQPTLRIAKKVVHNNKRVGIIIINMLLDDYLKELVNSYSFNIHIVDEFGNYIFSVYNKKSWSLDLNSKENFIKDKKLDEKKVTDIHDENIFIYSIENIIKSKNKIFLIFDTKKELVDNILRQNIEISIIILYIVLVVTIPLAFMISRIPSKLHNKLNEALNVIDKYVLMLTLNKKGDIENISEALSERMVLSKDEIIGKTYADFLSGINDTVENNATVKTFDKNFKENLKCIKKDGSYIWLYQDVKPLFDEQKLENGYACFFTDITDKKEIEKKAITDPLTKVNNRTKLNESLHREINLAKRYKRGFSIILMDIDFFKKINDSYGHQIGDVVLVEFADILMKNTRDVDVVGRYGGEEFLIILSDTSKEGAIKLAEKIRTTVEEHKFKGKYKVTASFGVSYSDENNCCVDTLLKKADDALYEAKRKGRNKVEFL